MMFKEQFYSGVKLNAEVKSFNLERQNWFGLLRNSERHGPMVPLPYILSESKQVGMLWKE